MKIVHITGNYFEGWGYQENLLPLYQKRVGNDVVIVSDNDHLKYAKNPTLSEQIRKRGSEYWYDGIKIYKIKTYLHTSTTSFFCKGLYNILEKECPDIIFHHDVNTSTLRVAVYYKRHHNQVKLFVDNHTDWINESKNRLWHLFYYDIHLPLHIKFYGNRVDYYIGVTPLRCQYLSRVFHVPKVKIRFLPIGCDTELVKQITNNREVLREMYNLPANSFVIVSGGKIDRNKGTVVLIDACAQLRQQGENFSLVLFGKIDDEVKQYAEGKEWITQLGWCDRQTTLSLLKMTDVACWPWLHTTLIEDSVAAGTPLLVKMSDNVSHFAQENAGVFMKEGDTTEIINGLLEVKHNIEHYRSNAITARNKYSYATLIELLANETFCELNQKYL